MKRHSQLSRWIRHSMVGYRSLRLQLTTAPLPKLVIVWGQVGPGGDIATSVVACSRERALQLHLLYEFYTYVDLEAQIEQFTVPLRQLFHLVLDRLYTSDSDRFFTYRLCLLLPSPHRHDTLRVGQDRAIAKVEQPPLLADMYGMEMYVVFQVVPYDDRYGPYSQRRIARRPKTLHPDQYHQALQDASLRVPRAVLRERRHADRPRPSSLVPAAAAETEEEEDANREDPLLREDKGCCSPDQIEGPRPRHAATQTDELSRRSRRPPNIHISVAAAHSHFLSHCPCHAVKDMLSVSIPSPTPVTVAIPPLTSEDRPPPIFCPSPIGSPPIVCPSSLPTSPRPSPRTLVSPVVSDENPYMTSYHAVITVDAPEPVSLRAHPRTSTTKHPSASPNSPRESASPT